MKNNLLLTEYAWNLNTLWNSPIKIGCILQQVPIILIFTILTIWEVTSGADWPFGNMGICPLGRSDFCAFGWGRSVYIKKKKENVEKNDVAVSGSCHNIVELLSVHNIQYSPKHYELLLRHIMHVTLAVVIKISHSKKLKSVYFWGARSLMSSENTSETLKHNLILSYHKGINDSNDNNNNYNDSNNNEWCQ